MTSGPPETLTIGKLARAAGVHVETIRYYQRRGLLSRPPRPVGGIRHYPLSVLARLQFIKRAQQLGFSLGEIGELLRLDNGACTPTRVIAERRYQDIAARINDLRMMQRTLGRLIRDCRSGRRAACPIIETLGRAPKDQA